MKRLPLLFLLLCLPVSAARAELTAIAFFSGPKQAEKKKTRWTLAEWLRTKENMRVQDLWLARHSPSPWEVIVGGDYRRINENESLRDRRLNVSIHRRAFGIGAERETHPNRWNTMLFWRFFGYHQQATMITLQAGRQFPELGKEPWFFGAQSNLYLLQFLGVEGVFRRVFAESG